MESMIGKTIDGYKILTQLGRGGMGIVYKALDVALEKVVAIKMMDPAFYRDEAFLRRFRSEAKALARLEAPHIVRIFALREAEEGLFIVMEYVDGITLADRIREDGAIPWPQALPIFKQLLDALGHAHRAGVIHRDIKPGNIMLASDGSVKVTDFGLAKVRRPRGPDSTVTMARAGTLHYMSPEQIKGVADVDHRSDIFSLGMTFYESLAGRTPFDKSDTDFTIQKKIVEGELTSLAHFRPELPKKLVKIVMKAVKRDPQARFQSTEEMLKAIEEFEVHQATQDGRQPVRRRVRRILLGVGAAALLALGIVFARSSPNPFQWISQHLSNIGEISPREFAALSIDTVPARASVFVNGDSVGLSPVRSLEVPPGKVYIHLESPNHTPFDTSISVRENQRLAYTFRLSRIMARGIAEEASDDTAAPAPERFFGALEVSSRPMGAKVWLDDRFLGTTPIEREEIEIGTYRILVTKDGFEPYSESLEIRSDRTATVRTTLMALTGGLKVTSVPSGASVYFNGEYLGKTALEKDTGIPVGDHQLLLRKPGYRDYRTRISVESGRLAAVSARLIRLRGRLQVLVKPWGSIYIDGKLAKKDTPVLYETELSAGRHIVAAVHPSLGRWEKAVEVKAGKTREIVVDFNRIATVLITSEPIGCEIYVDGKFTGKYTPKELKLRIGKHTIEVRRKGFKLAGQPRVINLDGDLEQPLHFVLKRIM
jgi:serine/threonine protein kinase